MLVEVVRLDRRRTKSGRHQLRWYGRLAAALAAVVALAGCGGDGEARPADPGPTHVHGLGINPADGALMVATHTGLWRIAAGGRAPMRVGEERHDTMGFAVIGPDHFLASGHPSAQDDDAPPHLGLIESRDGGRSWSERALGGEADFHTLRVDGARLVAIDARTGQLLLSRDDGTSWVGVPTPEPFFDFAASPDGTAWVASAADGFYAADDGGASWARLSRLRGLLAWPDPRTLFLVSEDGFTYVSTDGGARFARRGRIVTPAAVFAIDSSTLYVAAHSNGAIYVSQDGGRTWRMRTKPRVETAALEDDND